MWIGGDLMSSAYQKNTWIDRNVQYPGQYKDQNLVEYTFTADPGTITQAGSTITASRMNNIENGIYNIQTQWIRKIRLGGMF